jgi:hypothetical protein
MKAGVPAEDWSATNQRALMTELAWLSRRLTGTSNEPGAPVPESGAPALDTLCAMFRLSLFERQVVLLCAGMELDGGFAAQCAAAPGSGGNSWPSFGLVLALFPEAHWDALSSHAPLRHWRLIETIGNGPLVASRLQIDERILFFLTGVPQLDERLVSLIEPARDPGEICASQTALLERLRGAWLSAF